MRANSSPLLVFLVCVVGCSSADDMTCDAPCVGDDGIHDGGAVEAGPDGDAATDGGVDADATTDGEVAMDPLDAATDGSASECISSTLVWQRDGWVSLQRSALAQCRAFSYEWQEWDPDAGVAVRLQCENEIGSDATVGVGELESALAHVDVQAALAAAPILYGLDGRVFDDSIFRIVVADKVVEIGTACPEGAVVCNSLPEGVAALQSLLISLSDQQRSVDGCLGK